MTIKISSLVFFIIFGQLCLYAQKSEEIKLKNIHGVGYSDCISTSKANAIQEAKKQALNKAGVAENIQVQSALNKAEAGDSYVELFSSNVFTQMQGTVSNVEIINISNEIDKNTIVTNVSINCTVIKYKTESDPMFHVKVDGILPFYSNDSKLNFNVIPSMHCYMKAWLFTETDAFMLFPNTLEQSFLLTANDTIRFPSYKAIYRLDCEGKKQQINRIIIVFMKNEFPYAGKYTYKDISEWIFSLPPDQRLVKFFSTTLTKE